MAACRPDGTPGEVPAPQLKFREVVVDSLLVDLYDLATERALVWLLIARGWRNEDAS